MYKEVFDEIALDMSSRLLELKEYENIVKNLSVPNGDIEIYDRQVKIILKSMLPMIYAHWEGFVKSSTEVIFQYLNTLKLSSKEYNSIFLATAYEQDLIKAPDIINFEKRTEHLNCFYNKFDTYVNFGLKIDTEANLNFKVLEKICKRLNLNHSLFNDYSSDLNKLLEYRNKIVHGEILLPFQSYEQIIPHIELLENLMLDFQSEIQDLLKNEKYKKELNDESI